MTDRHLMYMIGAPGAGKTTLMRAALDGIGRTEAPNPVGHQLYHRDGMLVGLQLGIERGTFSGTDSLGMSAINTVIPWLEHIRVPVVGEGDRLTVDRMFKVVIEQGWLLDVVWLDTPASVCDARRRLRAVKEQSASWVAGRRTKVERLATLYAHCRLDGTRPTAELVDVLRSRPAVSAILGGGA